MYDAVIIGGGAVGCAVARELSRWKLKICLVEQGEDVCVGTSKANSAIVHAGFDAPAGSMKARFNVEGSRRMEALSRELDFPYRRNGALVVCFEEAGLPRLEELLQRENLLGELLAVDEWVVRVNWSVPKFDLHDSLKLNDALQALGVTDAFDKNKADFAPLTEQPAYVESVNQAARVKIDEEGVEAAAYTEVDTNAAAAPPQEMPEEEMNLNRPFLFVIWKDGAPLFVGAVQTMEGM